MKLAFEHLGEGEGNSTYRNRIIDAIYHMVGNTLEARAKYELPVNREQLKKDLLL